MPTPDYLSREHYKNRRKELEHCRKWITFVKDGLYRSLASAYVRDVEGHLKPLGKVSQELSKALVALTNVITDLEKLERIAQ